MKSWKIGLIEFHIVFVKFELMEFKRWTAKITINFDIHTIKHEALSIENS